MSRIAEKFLPAAVGGGAIALIDFALVEGAGAAGVAYDLTHEGYFADFTKTGNPLELLHINELNVGEAVSAAAIVASLALLFFSLMSTRKSKVVAEAA